MDFTNKSKILVYILLFTSFISFANSVFPQFDFQATNYPGGPVDIQAVASSGTQVNLYVNDNYIGKVDVLSNSQTIFLENSIQNEIIPIGANLIFKNNNPARIYNLEIVGFGTKILNFAQTMTFNSYNEGDVLFKDNQEGVTKKITVVDELANVTFPNAENYLQDGDNTLRFVVGYPLSTLTETNTFEYVVNYEKYSNTISLTNFTNVTNQREIKINGTVSDSSSPLYYITNYEGEITNLGALKSIPKNGNKFNITIQNLREGNNVLRFITTDPNNPNLFNGETKVNLLSDRTPPTITFSSGFRQFTNQGNLLLNISTDAVKLDYTFNGQNYTNDVNGGSILISLNLQKGKNDLTLIATDIANNIYKEAHQIEYDTTNPDIKKPYNENLDPVELADQKTLHFFFQKVNGKTNKPNVEMTIFTLPLDAKDGEGNSVSCNNYEKLFYRNLGQLDNQRVDSVEINLNETQISLLSLISNKKTLTSDSEGNFDTILTLQENSFNTRDLVDSQRTTQNDGNPTKKILVDSVESKNRVCFIMADKYGNVFSKKFDVTLDAGNTMWKPAEITTIPNTLYAAEVEQTGDLRSGNGYVEFGMIARFQYIGPGKVTKIDRFMVSSDAKTTTKSKFKIDNSRENWMFDVNTNELIYYAPVQIFPMNIKPLDYPSKLDFNFQALTTYTIDDTNIPIDERNPIYFQTSVNVERPLDHTKWLTPSTIESIQGFLNKTISINQKMNEYLGIASIGGVLTCTGMKFWHAYEYTAAASDPDPEKRKQAADKRLYMVCDRIASTASPYTCDKPGENDLIEIKGSQPNIEFKKSGEGPLLGVITPTVGGKCDYNGDGVPNDGYYVSAKGQKFSQESTNDVVRKVEGEVYYPNKCYPLSDDGNKVNIGKLNGNMCYNTESPDYDGSRCNFFGADNDNQYGSGIPGKDPSTSIISSIRCGAITDTYSHSKNMLKIQQGIYDCLEQAKIGVVKGSYCERLLGQAVCDVATNVILPELQQNINPRTGAGNQGDNRNPFTNFLGVMKANENSFNDRYGDTFLSKAGLGTDQIINKACLAAITGDWSVLTDNILNSIDQNEVEPVFGPPFPESRMQGYNPMTGELSIRYLFTYGVLSGGQIVRSSFEFVCDKNQPNGEYCPDDSPVLASQVPGSGIRTRQEYVPAGGSKQDTVVITDGNGKYWYNVLRVTHTYDVKGETRTKTEDFPIIHKKETLIAQCYFTAGVMGSGSGFSCNTIFGKEALVPVLVVDDKTRLLPTKQKTYFEGNSIFTDLRYDARNMDEFNQDLSLAYMAVCNEGNNGQYYIKDKSGDITPSVELKEGEIDGIPIYDGRISKVLFNELPGIGETQSIQYQYEITVPSDGFTKIVAKSTSTQSSGVYSISNILVKGEDLGVSKSNTITKDEIIIDTLNVKQRDKIQIIFSGEPTNIVFYLMGDGVSQAEFKKANGAIGLQTGTCNLYMRIIPSAQANDLTTDNFKTYSAISNDENLLTDPKLKLGGNGVYKTIFNLGKTYSDSGTTYFDLLSPYKDQTICVKKGSTEVKIPMEFVVQNTNNELKGVTLDYTLRSNTYGKLKLVNPNGINLKKNGLYKDFTSNNNDDINYKPITFQLEEPLTNSLNTIIDDTLKDKSWAQLFGLKPTQSFTLNYEIKEIPTGQSNTNQNIKTIEKGEVTFNIVMKNDCRSNQVTTENADNSAKNSNMPIEDDTTLDERLAANPASVT